MELISLCMSLFAFTSVYATDDLKIEVLFKPEECTKKSAKGHTIQVHYTGTLSDGKKFDSSLDRGQPLTFTLGSGQVIKGWDDGLTDMCVGEKRKLTIPSHLGYGKKGFGNTIPPESTLIFETELINTSEDDGEGPSGGENMEDVFGTIDADGDKQISPDEVLKYLWKMAEKLGDLDEILQDEKERDDIIKEIFEKQDLNKDGVVDEEEFYETSGAPRPGDKKEKGESGQEEVEKDEL